MRGGGLCVKFLNWGRAVHNNEWERRKMLDKKSKFGRKYKNLNLFKLKIHRKGLLIEEGRGKALCIGIVNF